MSEPASETSTGAADDAPPIPTRMRAAVITAPRTCAVEEVDTPVPAPDQVLIRVEGCGVCGSNLPLWEGRPWFTYPAPPGSLGHEGWGRIVALGTRARASAELQVGARVAFLSERAFADYDVASLDAVVPLPPTLDDQDVPGEPLGCVMNIWRRSAIQAGQTVAIVGLGFLGAMLTQLAVRAGARVIAISRRPWSLQLATALGAAETLELGDDQGAVVARVEALTGGALCERVIEVVGLAAPLELAAKLCGVRGRLVIAGFHQDGPRQIDMFLLNWRGLDVINAHERDPAAYVAGIRAAIDGVASRALQPDALYTDRIPLDRAGDAFELLRTRPDGFVKALVTP
jgi:threonine dehydrogenase-like Zn-dependent dehydrogenase